MAWLSSIGVGVLTGIVALLLSGYVANLAAGWHQMSSFEGAAGYFVVAMALIGLFVGFAIGVGVSRMVAGSANPGFLKALAIAQALTVGIIFIIGTGARLLADVPPRLDGEELLLAVEFRWPAGSRPAEGDSLEWRVRLSSSVNRTVRASSTGPLWPEDARIEEGLWIVPGAVDVFTSRGQRVLDVMPDGVIDRGFIIPLPGHPRERHLEWSEWFPHAAPGKPALPDGIRYRFRVVPTSRPIRTDTHGPFEVATVASSFGETEPGPAPVTWTAWSHFQVSYRGMRVVIDDADTTDGGDDFARVDDVAVLPGTRPALLVYRDGGIDGGTCHMVIDEGDHARTERVASCGRHLHASPLTSDPAHFARARDWLAPRGRLDRLTYATPAAYLYRDAVLDTRTLTVRPLEPDDDGRIYDRIPPLGVSPDGHSFARIAWTGDSDESVALAVRRIDTGESYTVRIDPVRTRFQDLDLLDPAWLTHYYDWQPGPDARERLVPRAHVTPLPYRGQVSGSGRHTEYRLERATEGLEAEFRAFLETEFSAEPMPPDAGELAGGMRIGTAKVFVSYTAQDRRVGVWARDDDGSLMAAIAERFEAALRTGRYDHLFAP